MKHMIDVFSEGHLRISNTRIIWRRFFGIFPEMDEEFGIPLELFVHTVDPNYVCPVW